MALAQTHYEGAEGGEAVGYVRLSQYDGGTRSAATLRQEGSIRDHAAMWRDDIVRVYVDDDRSASEDQHGFIKPRDGFNRLQADIASGAAPAKVYYYAHDRFLRNVEEGEQVRRWAKKHNVELVCCVSGGTVNLGDENAVFNFQLNTALGARETAATSRRIKEMFERSVIAKGTSLGGPPPFGYRQVGAKAPNGTDTRSFDVVPEEADVVRDIIERVARGETLTGIANDLNERGIPTRGKANRWGLTTVRGIALNGRYAGRMLHKGVDRGASAYPAIVDEATWRQAVAVLSDPKRMKRRAARKYLLSGGLLICGKCGEPLVSRPHYGRRYVQNTYSCVRSIREETKGVVTIGCAGVTIDAPTIEKIITAAVIDHIESKEFAADLRRVMQRSPKTEASAREIEEQQETITELYQAKKMTKQAYMKAMDRAAEQLAQVQASVSGDTAVSAVGRYAGRKGKLQAEWDDEAQPMSLDRRQAIVRAVLDHVVIAPVGRRGGNTFNPERVGDPVWK
jgi:DNA invertase Pin-like site-specific DNA recombinase